MITNQVMIRQMGDFDVEQRTKDSMFNATALLRQWNEFSGQQKRVDHFLILESTKEYIKTLEDDMRNYADSRLSVSYIITKGNKSKGIENNTWMHPYLFIDFAMWINPKFKLQVIKFVYDQLIEFRIKSCDSYKVLSNSTLNYYIRNHNRLPTKDEYSCNGALIQTMVLGKTFNYNPWQNVTEDKLKLRDKLEELLAKCYDRNLTPEQTLLVLSMNN